MTKVADDLSIIKDRKLWGRLAEYVEAGDMPPEGRPQPTEAEVEQLTRAIEEVLSNVDCGRETDPGRVTMRRLNRAEYNNTIRDLVGIDFHPADDFPSDDVGYGFDNIGDVLTLPPLLFEKYLAAAEATAEKAIVVTPGGADPQTLPESHRRIIFCTPTAETKSDCRAGDPRAICQPGLPPPRVRGRSGPADPVRRPRRGERRELRARDSARRGGGPLLAPVPVPGRVRSPVAARRKAAADASRSASSSWPRGCRTSSGAACPTTSSRGWPPRGSCGPATPWNNRSGGCSRDPKARGLVENFGDQWLQLRLLGTINPDTGQFPTFDDDLRRAMLEETRLFFGSVVRDDRSVLDFLDASDTFVNERLARHYGIPGDQGRRVPPRHARTTIGGAGCWGRRVS